MGTVANRREQTGTDRIGWEQTGTDRNRQEQTGAEKNRQEHTGLDRNFKSKNKSMYLVMDRNRQEQTGYRKLLHLNYCIIKKFIYQIGNLEVKNGQEQTGIYI